MRDCVNLRSLPKELAFFPLKHIKLYNSGHLIKNKTNLPKLLVNFVLIDWYYGDFDFRNRRNRKKNLDFDLIIDRLTPVYEYLQFNVLTKLISNFRQKKIQIIHIVEQWAEKSDRGTKKKIQDFIIEIARKLIYLKDINFSYSLITELFLISSNLYLNLIPLKEFHRNNCFTFN